MKKLVELFQKEIEAIQNIPIDSSLYDAVDIIFDQVHNESGKVVVSGIGKAGQIGVNIATTLSSTGTPAVFLHPSEAQHGNLGLVQPNDVLILISNSGKTREIIELEGLAKKMYCHMKVINLTGNPVSELAKLSDVILYTGKTEEICPLGLTPTTSSTVMTVIGHALVVLLMEKIDFTKDEYAKRHHGGYIGNKART